MSSGKEILKLSGTHGPNIFRTGRGFYHNYVMLA